MSFHELCRELRWIKEAECLIRDLQMDPDEFSPHAITELLNAVDEAKNSLRLQ